MTTYSRKTALGAELFTLEFLRDGSLDLELFFHERLMRWAEIETGGKVIPIARVQLFVPTTPDPFNRDGMIRIVARETFNVIDLPQPFDPVKEEIANGVNRTPGFIR